MTALLLATACSDNKASSPAPVEPPAAPTADRTTAPAPAGPTDGPRSYATAGEAVRAIVDETKPAVVGFGEYHELKGAAVQSAIARFRDSVVPTLARDMSDLILEVWARDSCGDKSAKISKDVATVTQRPAETESELVSLFRATKERGVQNHMLQLGCDDYDALLDDKGEVDYEKLLVLLADKLLATADAMVTQRRKADDPARAAGRSLVTLYGGALHNDLAPAAGTEDLAYAPRLAERAGGGYVEIDLFVPEYIADAELLQAEPWYPEFLEHAAADKVLVFQRAANSYVVILRKGLAKP